ncbi:ABC transporter ATP-binding protein [uncultured Pontibacter sp.]|uniref:ABC transporter ATP-binding protein n=1 Tax=uncultured Pontibacter sp. TaxID=453356 RepID=UPI0026216B42|nr:ABC transporter ATP-binding protein [uncultured Pontibacter sp.]
MLHIKHYSKGYHGQPPVLEIPELHLPHGLYWLQGENGSGKTTLLKSLAGLVPFTGSVSVARTDQQRQPVQYRRLVSYAEAEPVFPGFATGAELLQFYSRTKGGIQVKTKELLQNLGMATWVGNKTSTYSSGMLKKLSLLLAFVGEPQLILLDEPLTTLDAAASKTILEHILLIHRQGASFIITSHQPLDAQVLPYTLLHIKSANLHQAAAHA